MSSKKEEEDGGSSLIIGPCMLQNTHSLQAPQKSQLSDRVMENVDMRERDRKGRGKREREREGGTVRCDLDSLHKVELDVLVHRG